ncbi:MAG: AAA family ATPase [Bacteroidales bacterium]|nr:AAA family ATPase [Bacteroidales bacterium]
MRLKSLYIKDYKNIKDQTFDFSANTGYIALIGLNGSGKSNILEAISLIFDELYGIPHLEQVKGYRITYEIEDVSYSYTTLDENNNIIPLAKVKKTCPSSVIACYSGEDLRLWNMAYEKYYMQYFKKAIDNKTTIPQLVYINKYCWNIALMSLMCSEKESIKYFLKETFDIDNLNNVKVRLSFGKPDNFKNHKAMEWIKRIKENCLDENGQATMNSILSYEIPSYDKQSKEKTFFNNLYLLSQPKKNTKKGNRIDKYITEINIESNGISFNNYSEGHKKLILIECITQVLGDSSSLLLLDEPDSHVHIELKKDLLECIEKFEGQTILTTHSPIFTNLMANENIFPIEKGKAISAEQRDLIVKMANNNINYIDGACIISSKYIIVTEGPDDIYHIKNAISAFSSKGKKYEELKKASFIFMGGAKEVDNYFSEILISLYNTINKIVFAFDYDEGGREGAKMVQKLINSGHDRLAYVFYHKTYPVPAPDIDFYLEDFFERTTYNDVQLPNFNGVPSFAELKKATTWATSIKKRIQKHKRENSLIPNDYNGFEKFLDQLILSFGF